MIEILVGLHVTDQAGYVKYREHMLPLAEAIREEVKVEEHCVRSAY